MSPEEALRSRRFLNIGIVVRALPVQRLGGLEYHARDLAVGLANLGHRIYIVSTPGASKEPWPDTTAPIHVHELPTRSPGNYTPGFFRKLRPVLLTLCRQHSLDIIINIDLAGLLVNPHHFPVPVVPLIHGTLTSEVPLDWRYWQHLSLPQKVATAWKYKSRNLLKPVFRRMIRRSQHVLVDSEFTRRELLFGVLSGGKNEFERTEADLRPFNRRIHVVPLGIDLQRYPQSESSLQLAAGEPLRIALLGRLQEIKGISQAIRAADSLRARGVDFHMSIGGTGSYSEKADDLIKELDLQDNVSLIGRVAPDDIGRFMESHHVFVFPDLTQPAFGLVAVEAFCYGLPVVAAYVGAVPEVVTEECGWLYDPWKPNDLAAILAGIRTVPEVLKEKSAAAKARFAQFTADRMAERTEAAILEILD